MGQGSLKKSLGKLRGKSLVLKPKRRYDLVHVAGMIRAQSGLIVETLDATVDYLVLSDPTSAIGAQKKAATLNARGARIQLVSGPDMAAILEPTKTEFISLLKAGPRKSVAFNALRMGHHHAQNGNGPISMTVESENFAGCILKGLILADVAFDHCNFKRAKLSGLSIGSAMHCDFTGAVAASDVNMVLGGHRDPGSKLVALRDPEGSRFNNAQMAHLVFDGTISGADFRNADLRHSIFNGHWHLRKDIPAMQPAVRFDRTNLRGTHFFRVHLKNPVFVDADMTCSEWDQCEIEEGRFWRAKLAGADMAKCVLRGADFSGADLRSANLYAADLTGACFDGANLAGCNLRDATISGADFTQALNYEPHPGTGVLGPALLELDGIMAGARRIRVQFRVESLRNSQGDAITIDTRELKYGWGARTPHGVANPGGSQHISNMTYSHALLQAAAIMGYPKILFETLRIAAEKAPRAGKKLHDLMIMGLEEAFAQSSPVKRTLRAATQAYREARRMAAKREREQRKIALNKMNRTRLKKRKGRIKN